MSWDSYSLEANSPVIPLIREGSQDNKGLRRLPLIDIAGESLALQYSAAILIKRLLYKRREASSAICPSLAPS